MASASAPPPPLRLRDSSFLTPSLYLRETLTNLLHTTHHNPLLYALRARLYLTLNFPDLAAGDAYRGLLLTDYISDLPEDNSDDHDSSEDSSYEGEGDGEEEDDVKIGRQAREELLSSIDITTISDPEEIVAGVEQECLLLLANALYHTGAWRDAKTYAWQGNRRYGDTLPDLSFSPKEWRVDGNAVLLSFPELVAALADKQGETEDPKSRRVLYDWNCYEPDRFSRETVDWINMNVMSQASGNCVVDVVDLPLLTADETTGATTTKHLGVFAGRDIAEGEMTLREESVLTVVVDPVGGGLCEYCGTKCFPSDYDESTRHLVLKLPGQDAQGVEAVKEEFAAPGNVKPKSELFTCPTCLLPTDDDVDDYDSEDEYDDSAVVPTFCSAHCLESARRNYHRIFCRNRKLTPLYRGIAETLRRPGGSTSGAGVYALLLLKTFALSVERGVHPLLLPETRYLYGVPPTDDRQKEDLLLGWSFEENILRPIRILQALKIDIFSGESVFAKEGAECNSEWWAPWVVNTLIAKFRGVASGRLGADGKTEAAAAHTLFSLTNHDCEPNVRWECEGIMKFYSKREVKKGEEMKIAYCDIRMDVKERREWMEGCLGGWCMCERCVREEKEQKQKELAEKVEGLEI